MWSNLNETKLNTPILFLIFNRPDTTKKVFDQIRKAKPAELYVAADGPRKDEPGESALCNKTRAIIEEIDWDCDVHTLFRDKNLGCKKAISSGISWFFDNVDLGIILEDDCVPDGSFFEFCEELLNFYKNNNRIMMISGTNYIYDKIKVDESYFFSRYYSIWGWATWRRAWRLYDVDMTDWPEFKKSRKLDEMFQDRKIRKFYTNIFQEAYLNKVDTWDYQWVFACLSHQGLAIVPKHNLISNIGLFGVHFSGKGRFFNMPTTPMDISKQIHPKAVALDCNLERITFDTMLIDFDRFRILTILRLILYKLKNLI
jgi:hypothetical protein